MGHNRKLGYRQWSVVHHMCVRCVQMPRALGQGVALLFYLNKNQIMYGKVEILFTVSRGFQSDIDYDKYRIKFDYLYFCGTNNNLWRLNVIRCNPKESNSFPWFFVIILSPVDLSTHGRPYYYEFTRLKYCCYSVVLFCDFRSPASRSDSIENIERLNQN